MFVARQRVLHSYAGPSGGWHKEVLMINLTVLRPTFLALAFLLFGSFRSCTSPDNSFKYYYAVSIRGPSGVDKFAVYYNTDKSENLSYPNDKNENPIHFYRVVLKNEPSAIDTLFAVFLQHVRLTRNDTTVYEEGPPNIRNWFRTRSYAYSPDGGEDEVTYTLYLDSNFKPVVIH